MNLAQDPALRSIALTGMVEMVGHRSAKQKVAGSIPGQGPCLGCGFGPRLGHIQEATDQYLSLTSMFLSPSFSLPSPSLKINK